jgi:hypothetical protein
VGGGGGAAVVERWRDGRVEDVDVVGLDVEWKPRYSVYLLY